MRTFVRDLKARGGELGIRHAARRGYRAMARRLQPELSARTTLSSLYAPKRLEVSATGKLVHDRPQPAAGPHLPLPPPSLRMMHAAADDQYLAAGAASATWIRRVVNREGVALANGLDWGCATGRVLRHFEQEARAGNWWGADASGDCIEWAKANLSPPFRFITSTAFPHLPFEDNTFDVVFGGSVFTHIYELVDMWLMEFRRIMAPGGVALFTVHDEHTRKFIANHPDQQRAWRDRGWASDDEFTGSLDHDVEVVGERSDWGQTTTFFRRAYISREWGQYLDVVSFEPEAESYQTAVVLRKR
jgi:SAM-dependent methyltransferase